MLSTDSMDPASIKKILVVQFRTFGDVLLATSYLEALIKRFANSEIDFLVKQPFHQILYKNAYVSHVVAFKQGRGFRYFLGRTKLFLKVRRRNYDLIIDQQNGTGSGQVVLFSGARYKLGWSDGKWRQIYNPALSR